MNIAVSNLCYQGLFTNRLMKLPKDIGIEVYSEAGSDFWWDRLLPKLMDGRTSGLSVHGPYQNLDLSSPDLDFNAALDFWKWNFALCKRHHATHCVCHPYAYVPVRKMTGSEKKERMTLCLRRVKELNKISQGYGIELLVENMADKDGLLSQREFNDLFGNCGELLFLIDTGHANIQGWDMELMFEALGDRIRGYHINDNFGDADSHLKVFEGNYDWEKFFAFYKEYTPEAALVCEYMSGTIEELVTSVRSIQQILQ